MSLAEAKVQRMDYEGACFGYTLIIQNDPCNPTTDTRLWLNLTFCDDLATTIDLLFNM